MSDADHSVQRVLLVGWSLASWDLINPLLDRGELPHLQSLVDKGTMGSLRTHRPLMEEVVFHSLATGALADKHGVLGPFEVSSDDWVRPTDSHSRRAKALWEILSDAGRDCHVVNFPLTSPAEKVHGTFVSPLFFETVPQSYQQNFTTPRQSVNPESEAESLRQFIVTLEDIDAQVIESFVPRFRELDVADPRLVAVGAAAAQTLSVHSVTTWLMEQTSWDVMCVSYDLIDRLGKLFFHLRQAATQSENEADLAMFTEMVAGAARVCDQLLGRLLELSGEETTVVLYSPWGIQHATDASTLESAANPTYLESVYRGEGIFLMRAPGMPADELLHQVNFLDICPTVLHSSGVTATDEMDGCAVQRYLESPLGNGSTTDAWTHQGLGTPTLRLLDQMTRPQSMRLDEPFVDKPVRRVEQDNLWTLAAVLLGADRREEAIPLLLRLYHANPLDVERGPLVAESLYQTGHLNESLELLRPLAVVFEENPVGQFAAGFVALNEGKLERAKEMFELAEANNPAFPILFYHLGQVYLLLNLPEKSVDAFLKFLALDPCLPHAFLGLSEALLRCKRFEEAADAALSAVGARFSEPAMHLALGRAMAQLGETDRAREAYETVLRMVPNHELARDHLQWLDQYSREATPDPSQHNWRALTPPLHPQFGSQTLHGSIVSETQKEISTWRNDFTDALEQAERELDTALSLPSQDAADAVDVIRQKHWVLRPVEPADQSALQDMSFPTPFASPSEKEIFVTHAVGSQEMQGAVMLVWTTSEPTDLRLRLSLPSKDHATDGGPTYEQIQHWLIRAGLARAVAGGATRVRFTFADDPNDTAFHDSLAKLGFSDLKLQDNYEIDARHTRDIGLGQLERYRKRDQIPEEVRLTSMNEVPVEQVDAFLKQWFADGVGDPPGNFHLPECPVMLKGDQIIACAVGYVKNDELFVITRIGVLPAYRKKWATPWLLGGASQVSVDFGRTKLQFITDGSQYPEFIKIAKRHFKAEHKGVMRTMAIELDPEDV